MVLWSRDDTIALRADELPPALLPSARIVHVDDVDQQAAIQVALAAQPGDRHERYRSRHRSNRRARRRGQHPDSGRARAGHALTGESRSDAPSGCSTSGTGPSCVTLGRSGAMIVDDGRVHYAPAFAVDAVDTTGAGDVFRGAFIYGLLRGDAPPALLRFANAAARSAAPAVAR